MMDTITGRAPPLARRVSKSASAMVACASQTHKRTDECESVSTDIPNPWLLPLPTFIIPTDGTSRRRAKARSTAGPFTQGVQWTSRPPPGECDRDLLWANNGLCCGQSSAWSHRRLRVRGRWCCGIGGRTTRRCIGQPVVQRDHNVDQKENVSYTRNAGSVPRMLGPFTTQ